MEEVPRIGSPLGNSAQNLLVPLDIRTLKRSDQSWYTRSTADVHIDVAPPHEALKLGA
jgi:hypothetical protein